MWGPYTGHNINDISYLPFNHNLPIMTYGAAIPGVYTPVVTFFKQDGSLDDETNRLHIITLAKAGITGFLLHGSMGEAALLSHEERTHNIAVTRDVLNEHGFKDAPIIAGATAQSVDESLLYCNEAYKAGASHAIILPPSYYVSAMTETAIKEYYFQIASKSPLPIIIYNFPGVTSGISLNSNIIKDLATHSNIVGAKLTCGNLGTLNRVASALPAPEFTTFAGRGEFFLHSLIGGSSGVISGLSNLAPKIHVRLFEHYNKGQLQEAKKLQDLISNADLPVDLAGLSAIKTLLKHKLGYGSSFVRSPLLPVSDISLLDSNQDVLNIMKTEKSL